MTASTQSSLPAHDVAIDELMKAEAITGNVMPLLTYIGRVLDSLTKFHALVSTLDPEVVGNITASSGRPVHWVPLSPISYKHSIEAVAKHRLKFWVSARARRSGQNLLSDHSSPRNAAQCKPSSPIATAILARLRKP